jgi:hypothetical protein
MLNAVTPSTPAPATPAAPPPASATGAADTVTSLTERLKARSFAKPTSPLETAEAIRNALLPRRRASARTTDAPSGAKMASETRPLRAGIALLTVVLVIQLLHHYRHDLAATPQLNRPLTLLYGAMGVSLVPRWDLGSYEVRQLGASTDAQAPGQILVRASVKNGARQPQPLPLLRVTLQDRFGNRIASRDVPPQAYLPRAISPDSLLSSGQRIDAEMAFVDPGANAVGFEIDACLPAPGGGIACANDAAR